MDYRPDWQPTKPGLLVSTENVIPDKAGNYFTSYTAESSGYTGSIFSSGSARGARMVTMASGTKRLIVGGYTLIKEANGSGGWTDRTSTTPGSYSLSATDRWWFEPFGDMVVACNGVDATEKSTTGIFSTLTGAPKAKVIISQSGHLLALNYNDGSANPAGIKWCSQDDATDWTASASNSAGSITLKQTPGPIVAGAQLHDIAVVWKAKSMYVGRRVGGTEIWQFNLLSPSIGCISQEAWVATPAGIIFVSDYGVYLFDGSIPRPIDDGVRVTLFNAIFSASTTAFMSHDEQAGTIYIWLRSGIIECFAYNYFSDKWSVAYKLTGKSSDSSGELGHATYLQFICTVRDANYTDAVALGVSVPASGLRTAHLIVGTGNVLVNLSSIVPADAFRSRLQTGLLRSQDAAPDELSEMERITPLWATSTGTVREPTSATANVQGYARVSGAGGFGGVDFSMGTDKQFETRSTGKVLDVLLTWVAQYVGLQDLAYKLRKSGSR